MKKLLIICITALLASCSTNVDLEQQVDELYAKMSQEERIAQLRSMYMDELLDDQGKVDTAKCRQLIPNGIGHFSQFAMQKPTDPNVLRDRVAACSMRKCYQVSTHVVLRSIHSRLDKLVHSTPNWPS